MIKESSKVQLDASKSLSKGFGSVIDKLSEYLGPFGFLVKGLGNVLVDAMSSISMSSATGGGSSGVGSGIFSFLGNIFGGGGGAGGAGVTNALTTAADASAFLLAKGGVLPGARGLSQYSNSVVDSPTMFAFAKGGIPPSKGLMGEAGPEAIMPLRRDSRGNLGVSGGGNTNNITINITMENGQAKSTNIGSDAADQTAAQLGNIIKNVVSQELLKQSRPGGLLAR